MRKLLFQASITALAFAMGFGFVLLSAPDAAGARSEDPCWDLPSPITWNTYQLCYDPDHGIGYFIQRCYDWCWIEEEEMCVPCECKGYCIWSDGKWKNEIEPPDYP